MTKTPLCEALSTLDSLLWDIKSSSEQSDLRPSTPISKGVVSDVQNFKNIPFTLVCFYKICDNIRKLDIFKHLTSVEHLKRILEERLEIKDDFLIQCEDPEFENELCNLN